MPACDVVTIGESMVLFQPLGGGTLAHAPLLARSVAGAESNVAIALSRLGLRTRWISRLGRDAFGDIIQSTLQGENVEVWAARDEGAPTAVFFRENRGWGEPQVWYFRRGSAAIHLSPADVQDAWFAGARHLHVSGITPALSESARDMIFAAMRMARKTGLSISFDPNIRRKLWNQSTFWHETSCRQTLLEMVSLCDIFLPGIEEAEFLIGAHRPEEFGREFQKRGAKVVVLKMGAQGALGWANDEACAQAAHAVERITDPIGAGDAFAAGFLSVWLQSTLDEKSRLAHALRRANLLGALATQFAGDWEALPRLSEIEAMEQGNALISR